ncbi:class I SAM-dependent DNA methyltransferase [Hymenobacter sp. UV11]|uniref:class I SAM-dependent DNA methyltransferase n=1 Tax=Hymenobacter sp. UV11 TaxID=1849735 RepID=UPI00105DBE81|nr:DNA methyltransferase [Hymenobacter sp. UV11]TDN36783.1 DNA methyltransferase [Hymenobacter sp. UV11]TFZ63684.1 class I SAM-dependent DNA methyltransferase [Hymenobacter sp. UV11]
MNYSDFEARWLRSGGAEHANYGLFLQDLCDLLGVSRPDPTTDDPAQDAYVFERGVTFDDGAGKRSTGRIDLYKRGCFVLETKQGTDTPDQQAKAAKAELGQAAGKRRKGHAVRGTAKWGQMVEAAREQALRYVRALPASEPRPPFVVVVDVGYSIDLYSNFAGVGDSYVPFPDSQKFRVLLPALADADVRARLRLLFTDPQQLDPARLAAQVTRRLAGYLAGLSTQLEKVGHAPDVVAQFLMRCLFTMFAEDVELIPKKSFSKLLAEYADTAEARAYLPEALASLWATMDKGGFSPALRTRVRHFNGKLFHDATALPLNADQVALLQQAAEADWTLVEPAIFGTLLERALDPKERHSLGAHYTPRRYVERLVLPTVMEPLRQEWAAAQAASAQRLAEGRGKKAVDEARAELLRFLHRLTSVRILDPACGSGNFLYVTLEHLKRLEGEVLSALGQLGQSGRLELGDGTTVGPRQLLGLELNPRAAAIADVVLRIGYLQWHLRTYGLTQLREPLLDDYQNIQQQDAVLSYDGPDFQNARPAVWPEADFIVGNPPFIGDKAMRGALGNEYVKALRKAYKGYLPESADLVMYWWNKAARIVQMGNAERFGFITTNSITQQFNRQIIQPFLNDTERPLSLYFAIPSHPWVEERGGAAVQIAMTAGQPGIGEGVVLQIIAEEPQEDGSSEVSFRSQYGRVNADLTVGANLDIADPLRANEGICNLGVSLFGAGFMVSPQKAEQLGLGTKPGLQQHIRPYLNGRDMVQISRQQWVIDLLGLTENQVLTQYPEVYQHIFEEVKPERDRNNRESYRRNWWIFGEPRKSFRPALAGLERYIATTLTAKHRLFQFVEEQIIADDSLVVVASDNAYYLGVLSSRIHVVWALAAGADLGGNTPRYRKTRCFDPFPFPTPTAAQQAHIRELAEALDAHRKRQQAQHPSLTLTDLYNVVEKQRASQPLTAKEQITHAQGLAAVVLSLHQQLDAAVAEAYGWPADLPDAEILTRLVQLNHTRQQEEAAGTVRYLRPAYQAPEQQAALALPAATAPTLVATAEAGPQPWPAELAQQMQAVRGIVQQASQPMSSAQVAARFRRTRPERVQPLLDTLAAMSLVRFVEEDNVYAS